MLKRFLMLLTMFTLFSCEEPTVFKQNTGYVFDNQGTKIKILEIDSCEYLLVDKSQQMGLAHKGNCKFCLSRNRCKN